MRISWIDLSPLLAYTALYILENDMKIVLNLIDETTVTNTTVKITAWITGIIQGDSREKIEARVLEAWKRLFPDGKQSFSSFTYQPDGLTFRVQAVTRIDASLNDQLNEKAKQASDDNVKIQIHNIDPSIPVHDMRAAESDLRVRMLDLAKAEASKLGGTVAKMDFTADLTIGMANNKALAFNATYAASPAGGAPQLGHSEKLSLSAVITVMVE